MNNHEEFLENLIKGIKNETSPTYYDADKHLDQLHETLSRILTRYRTGNGEESAQEDFSTEVVFDALIREYATYCRKERDIESYNEENIKALSDSLAGIIELHRLRKQKAINELYPRVHQQLKRIRERNPITLDFLQNTAKSRNENAHSDILAALLDSERCPNISPVFLHYLVKASLYHSNYLSERLKNDLFHSTTRYKTLENFCQELLDNKVHTRCQREVSLENGMRIDLFISTYRVYIVIENKVDSCEHDCQTMAYNNWLVQKCGDRVLPYGILLSPGRITPDCPDFATIDYEDVRWCLVKALSQRGLTENELIYSVSYLNSLKNLIGED